VSAVIEGAITVAAVRAIERLNSVWLAGGPAPSSSRALPALAMALLVLVVVGTLIASTAPDGIQRLTAPGPDAAWTLRVVDGIGGLILILALCFLGGKLISRRRSA